MTTWEPEAEQLRQLAQYLKDSLSGHDQNAQKKAEVVSLAAPLARPLSA